MPSKYKQHKRAELLGLLMNCIGCSSQRAALLCFMSSLLLLTTPSFARCDKVRNSFNISEKNQVYMNVPFKQGEEQHYELFYMGVFVGYGKLEVKEPVQYNGLWHNVFAAAANTAPSYEVLFKGDEKMMAYSLPGSYAVSKFKLEQDEKKLLGDRYLAEKWITFDHDKCYVKEIIQEKGKPQKIKRFDLISGANDILSSFYHIREMDFKIGKMQKFLVYTSEKSWWAEATPIKFEAVKVGAGEFKSVKLSMKTFVGNVAEQSGDMFLWVAIDHPSRPMVQVQGEVKIGTIKLELKKFKAGQ